MARSVKSATLKMLYRADFDNMATPPGPQPKVIECIKNLSEPPVPLAVLLFRPRSLYIRLQSNYGSAL